MDQTLKLNDKPIKAGFPNAADEAVYSKLNLHKLLIKRPASTYFMRLEGNLTGESYRGSETLLIVDRGAEMRSSDIVVAVIRGEMVVKQYKVVRGRHWLLSTRHQGKTTELTDESDDVQIWGVVLYRIETNRDFGGEF